MATNFVSLPKDPGRRIRDGLVNLAKRVRHTSFYYDDRAFPDHSTRSAIDASPLRVTLIIDLLWRK
jgi:hypothetical protein